MIVGTVLALIPNAAAGAGDRSGAGRAGSGGSGRLMRPRCKQFRVQRSEHVDGLQPAVTVCR